MKVDYIENQGIFQKQKNWFRHFHRYPELSMKEYKTTNKIKEILKELGITILPYQGKTGVVALIEGTGEGPEVVLRTDIDALPIQEISNLEYRSTVDDVSHMCGHDFHMSAILGAAAQLIEDRDKWRGRIKLIFQPGEETTEGARTMIENGVLSGKERAIFGLHNAPFLPAGIVGYRNGPLFASADTLEINIKGKKGHAAMPHLAVDATVAASAIVMGLQSIISRNTNPLDSAVITIGSFHSGYGHNIISDLTEMRGTVRTFRQETREMITKTTSRIIEGISNSYGAQAEYQIIPQTPPVNNDSQLTEQFLQSVLKILPREKIMEADLIMAAEDFALFQEKIPGCYFLVGTGDPSKGIKEGWHHPEFKANENILPLASKILVQAALDVLAD